MLLSICCYSCKNLSCRTIMVLRDTAWCQADGETNEQQSLSNRVMFYLLGPKKGKLYTDVLRNVFFLC